MYAKTTRDESFDFPAWRSRKVYGTSHTRMGLSWAAIPSKILNPTGFKFPRSGRKSSRFNRKYPDIGSRSGTPSERSAILAATQEVNRRRQFQFAVPPP